MVIKYFVYSESPFCFQNDSYISGGAHGRCYSKEKCVLSLICCRHFFFCCLLLYYIGTDDITHSPMHCLEMLVSLADLISGDSMFPILTSLMSFSWALASRIWLTSFNIIPRHLDYPTNTLFLEWAGVDPFCALGIKQQKMNKNDNLILY